MGTPICRLAAALAALLALAPAAASAQAPARDRFAIASFEPAPAGDRFFGVESPELLGHGAFDAQLLADVGLLPFAVERPAEGGGSEVRPVVPSQIFFHPGLAVTVWDRFKLSADLPLGASTVATDVEQPSEETETHGALGDLRGGLRLRIFGEPGDDVRASVSGYLWLPTGDAASFAGEGATRGSTRLVLGGRFGSVTWGATAGVVFRPPAAAAGVTFGRQIAGDLGLAFPFLDKAQLLVEGRGAAVVEGEDAYSQQTTQLDLLFGMRGRFDELVGALGVGLGTGVGTGGIAMHTVLSFAYAPLERASGGGDDDDMPSLPTPPQARPDDRDGDRLPDYADACPDEGGLPRGSSPGCPDADGDGVPDASDACPARPGPAATRGCVVEDRDADSIPDADDACPMLPGPARALSRENGCPEDADSDGVTDSEDACPAQRGHFSLHPERNGCPREGEKRR